MKSYTKSEIVEELAKPAGEGAFASISWSTSEKFDAIRLRMLERAKDLDTNVAFIHDNKVYIIDATGCSPESGKPADAVTGAAGRISQKEFNLLKGNVQRESSGHVQAGLWTESIKEGEEISHDTAIELMGGFLARALSKTARSSFVSHIRQCESCHDKLLALELSLFLASQDPDQPLPPH